MLMRLLMVLAAERTSWKAVRLCDFET